MHLAIIGYGNIAQTAVAWLAHRPVARLTVLVRPARVAALEEDAALSKAAPRVSVVGTIDELLQAKPDLVVECAGHQVVAEHGPRILRAGHDLVLVSIGALADQGVADQLRLAAEAGSAQMTLPSGAIGGIDLLAALALAGDVQVSYRGTKPPAAWAGTRAKEVCDLSALTSSQVFFEGTAREAAMAYPKNANVAATLALAGAGFDSTRVSLIADPAATGNQHAYEVSSPAGGFAMTIDNAASAGNAKTSVATVYSVLREINRKRDAVMI